ncbi:MAG: DUF4886 domain-containing protein [Dysgonomonas sp.]|uniref:DUF4886 domain-containing protein n=1 Tax=Dysgonomonas sp. TaxID=1891233 RepID=UPI0039E612E1
MSGENSKLVPKKFNEFTKVTDPTGCTFAGYNGSEDIQIEFSNMTPLFGVTSEEGSSSILAGSQDMVSKKADRTDVLRQGSFNFYDNYRWTKGTIGFAYQDIVDDSAIKDETLNTYFDYKGKFLEIKPIVTGVARDYRIVIPISLAAGQKLRITAEFHLTNVSYCDVKILAPDGATELGTTQRITGNGLHLYTQTIELTANYEKVYLFFPIQPSANVSGAIMRVGRIYGGTSNQGSLDGDNIQIENLTNRVNLEIPVNSSFKGLLSYSSIERQAVSHIQAMEIVMNDITMPVLPLVISYLGYSSTNKRVSIIFRTPDNNIFRQIVLQDNVATRPTGLATYELKLTDMYFSYIKIIINWDAGVWIGTNLDYFERSVSTLTPKITKSLESERFAYLKGKDVFVNSGGLIASGVTNDTNFKNTGFRSAKDLDFVIVRNFPATVNTGLIGWFKKSGEDFIAVSIVTGGTGQNFNYNKFVKPAGATHYMVVTLSDEYAPTAGNLPTTNSYIIEPVTLRSFSNSLRVSTSDDFALPPRQILNPPLPQRSLTDEPLKILFIASSWMRDTWFRANKVIAASGVNVTMGAVYYGGMSYKQTLEFYKDGTYVEFQYSENGEDWNNLSPTTIQTAVKYREWDIIIIQQAGHEGFYWENYQPYMREWIHSLKTDCPNPNVYMAMNHTWTPMKDGQYVKLWGFDNQSDMWEATLKNIVKASYHSGIDLIIPCGMAIYSARTSSLQNALDLTCGDELHLDQGIGRYITACTLFEALIKPIYRVSIKGNTYRDPTSNSTPGLIATPITDDNAPIAQACAISACANRFGYTDLSNL